MYFDDVSLSVAKCILARRTEEFAKADFIEAGDDGCVVNYKELDKMTADWLIMDAPEVGWDGPWYDNDIGDTNYPGSFAINGDTYTVTGSGNDIWNDNDNFHYVYKSLTGDGRLTARVVSIGGTSSNNWQKAGVMIRENLDPNSVNVMMGMSQGGAGTGGADGHGDMFQWREQPGDWRSGQDCTSSHVLGDSRVIKVPTCVRLVRVGDKFSGYVFYDGQWHQEGSTQTIEMPETVYIGLAVTSHDNNPGIYTTAQFDPVCDLSFAEMAELFDDGIINFKDYAKLMQWWLEKQLFGEE